VLGLCISLSASAQGKVWAVVIGVDEYVRESLPRLRYAVADARLFSQALQESLKLPREQIFLLTSDSVDEASVPRALNVGYILDTLSRKATVEDTLIFYFAGHGVTLNGEPYLLTEEADIRTPLTLKLSSLHQGEIVEALRKARVGKVWMVLDACRNHPGQSGESRLSPEASRTVTNADVGLNQTASMFSCKVGERSWEWDEQKHGYFTYYLVQGLRASAADPNGRVTIQGLSQYLTREVPEATRPVGGQTPWMLYGGPGPDQWLLTSLSDLQKRPQPAAYVAKLESLQAQLDQETARRVAAEQKARLEESKRLELEKRLALLERQLAGKESPISPSMAANPRAYQEGHLDPQALRHEAYRLSQENAQLRKKLGKLQSLAPTGVLSLPGQASDPQSKSPLSQAWEQASTHKKSTLSQAWRQASAQEETTLSRLSHEKLSPQDKVRLQLQLRQAYSAKIEVLEKIQAGIVTLDTDRLQRQVEFQRQISTVCRARLAAARTAEQEASLRLRDGETLQSILAMQSLLEAPIMAEVAVLEDGLRQLRGQHNQIQSRWEQIQQHKLAQRRALYQQEERLATLKETLDHVPACTPGAEPILPPPPP